MSYNEKKYTLDDILAEYTDADIAEEITLGDDDVFDDTEIPQEPFELPKPESSHTWAEELSSYESKDSAVYDENRAAEKASSDAEESADEENDESMDEESAACGEIPDDGETSEKRSQNNERNKDDVNDRWIAKAAKTVFPAKGDGIGETIRKIIFLAAVIVFVGAGIMLISTLVQSNQALETKESLKNIITTTAATSIDSNGNVMVISPTSEEVAQHNIDVAEYFKAVNEDYIGYLEIAGCDIYEPVVRGEDNDYYLRINISGRPNKAGTVFMDYRCTVTEDYTSPNIVIYGHNQEDGTMFGNLKNYKWNAQFYAENPVIKFNPEFESGEYLIYAFFVTNAYEKQDSNGIVFHYHDYIETMNDENTFEWYMGEVQKRNQIVSPVDVRYGDKLLCLSTCSNEFTDSRFVVFARKLREGETISDYDFSRTYLNPNAQGVDWDAIMSGMTESEILDDDFSDTETRKKTLNKRNEKTEIAAEPESEEETGSALPTETSAAETTPKTSAAGTTKETAAETTSETRVSKTKTKSNKTTSSTATEPPEEKIPETEPPEKGDSESETE